MNTPPHADEALPQWDVSGIFPALESTEFAEATLRLETQLSAAEAFLDAAHIRRGGAAPAEDAALASLLDEALTRLNALLELYATLQAYVYAFVSTDSFNTLARRKLSALEQLGVRLQQLEVRLSGWLGGLTERLPGVASGEGTVGAHRFYLLERAEQSRYLMSEAEESLAAELNLSGGEAWSKLQGTVTSQLTVAFDQGNGVERVTMPALINLMQHHPSAEVRCRAYQAELAAWEQVKETLAAALNGVKGATNTLCRRRGRRDALHLALDQARIDAPTLEAMMDAIQASLPAFRRYLRAKARRLGNEGGLPWWNLFAPVEHNPRAYRWDEARDFLLDHFSTFSPRLVHLTRRAFDERWIDAPQKPGKRPGAFCMDVPLVKQSRILCNYDGSLDQVFTLAHELGHAFHNECLHAAGKRPLQAQTPMTLAETASIFCETLIVDAVLRASSSDAERLSVLETDLIGRTQVIVDITSRFLFEREVFERRQKAELAPDELCEIMARCQRQTYGDGLDERYLHPFMWTWKPHYYSVEYPFYNFPYAFGLLFGLGLYALYQQEGAAFVPRYERLLSRTGEATPQALAAEFGIDLRDSAFWRQGLALIAERIEHYAQL
ncbi:MAG: M3 family oligoendopeptidase [Anaerolineae bacterium]|nr:M3 family oligoendopeptidase [Anaerolineae bacterium]